MQLHNLKQIIIFACGNQNIEEYGESFYHNWIHQARVLLRQKARSQKNHHKNHQW